MTEDEKLINDLLKAGEDYLFAIADVISGRTVQYPDKMTKTRGDLIQAVLKVAEASRNRQP